MGWSAIASSRTTQSGSYQSQVATAVNTAVDVDTGYIDAALNWSTVFDGQAFAIIRASAVIAVRCIKSVSTTRLTYYRLYRDDDTELATDVQVGDTITLYEAPEIVGAGSALSAVSGITLTATGAGEQLFRRYAIGDNACAITGFFQIPSKHLLEFGAAAPGQTMRIDAGGRLAVGWYRTRSGVSVFCADLLVRGTKQEVQAYLIGNSMFNPNTATSRLDWFGGIEESGSLCYCDVAGATARIYSKAARTRGLGLSTDALTEQFQIRFSSSDAISYGFTSENRTIVLVGNPSIGGYAPRQQGLAFSFSSSTPPNTWITIPNPALRAGNIVDVAFWSSKWGRIINNETGSNVTVGGNQITSATGNRGLHEYRAEVTANIRNTAGTGLAGRIFCRDRNNGSRLSANQIGSNPDYAADRTYESALSAGAASFTTDGGVLLACAYQNVAALGVDRFSAITWDYRGLDNSSTDRFTFGLASYGYDPAATTAVLKGIGGVAVAYTMLADSGVTASSTTAATYTDRFSISGAGHITVTANATLDQLYDYAQIWLQSSGANMEVAGLGAKLIAYSGSALSLTKNVTVNVGATLSSGAKYSTISTTGTITVNGAMAVTAYTDVSGTQAGIVITGLEAGSRIQVYNVTDSVELINSVVPGSMFTGYVAYSSDKSIRLRATYCSGVTAKDEYQATGTLTSSGAAFTVSQVDDVIYNTAAIDGSTVTEFASDYPNVQVDVTDPDGVTTVQRLHAWWMYNLTTASGIANFFGGLIADDAVNFRIVTSIINLKLDNQNAAPVVFAGGRLYHDEGTTVIAATSGSIQMDPDRVYQSVAAEADLAAIRDLVEADEIHTGTTIQKRLRGTATPLLTKNWTGRPLLDFQAIQP